jgi:hypothetical protein
MIGTVPACQTPSKKVQVLVMAARFSPRMPCGASFDRVRWSTFTAFAANH